MKLDRNDPRWTAYVLDELEPEARARFEAEMAADPGAEATLAETREALELVVRAFSEAAPASLTETQREEILAAVPEAPVAAATGHRVRNWTLATGLAASLLIGVVTLSVVQDVPDPAGTDDFVAAAQQAQVEDTATVVLEDVIPAETAPQPPQAAAHASSAREVPARTSSEVASANEPEVRQDASSLVDFSRATDSEIVGQTKITESPLVGQEVLDRFVGGQIVSNGVGAANLNQALVNEVRAELGRAPAVPEPARVDQNRSQFNTEEYDRITDNTFRLVADEPLATFSVDVDTASYANVRRFLNQRTLPPPDAVRIEEMVNYFRYDYAPPSDGRPVRIHAEVAAAPWRPEHRLVRIGIQGQEIEREARASNLVFLIDVSGSMDQPDKLPLLVDGMKLLVEQLGENDRVAIVVYAGASGLVLDSTPGFRTQRIVSALERLRAGGSTNGGAGIQLAYDVAVRNFIDGGINRVILATDGDFNIGVTNNGELTRLIEERAGTGVFLSVLGFGTGNLNDAGLEALADRGNGNYAYIDTIREARKVLVEEIGSTLITIAKDVKIQIEFNPAEVSAYRLIGYENRVLQNQDFADDTVDAGEIGSGHTVTALFEIVPPGVEFDVPGVDPLRYQQELELSDRAGIGELLTVAVRYKAPDGDVSQLIEAPVVDRGQSFEAASADHRFAAAVAGFGMLLRDSPYKGSASFDDVVRIGEGSLGEDTGEYRREFVELVRRARAIRDLD